MNLTIDNSIHFKASKLGDRDLAENVLKQMTAEGKVQNLSVKESARLDHELAMALKPIQQDFFKKSNAVSNALRDVIMD